MSEQTASQWRLKVSGGDQVSVRPGESLEIGRKPLRPLPDEGIARLEIDDATKSMSKRHARFSVAEDGSAVLRDLDSTNGSYVVNEKGELLRMPAGRDVPLSSSPMRIQFGDVPIDFVRIEPDTRPVAQVSNLFEYSTANTVRQEPEAADMSVDEILDLRAGEPTTVFNAQHARHAAVSPLARIADIEPVTFAPITHTDPDPSIVAVDPAQASDMPVEDDAAPAGTSGDAHDDASRAVRDAQPVPAHEDPFADADDAATVVFDDPAAGAIVPAGAAAAEPVHPVPAVLPSDSSIDEPPADSMPLRVVDPLKPSLPRDLFADAMTASSDAMKAVQPSQANASTDRTTPIVVAAAPTAEEVVAGETAVSQTPTTPAADDAAAPGTAVPAASGTTADEPVRTEAPADPRAVTFVPMNAAGDATAVAASVTPDETDATGVYTPAFEPGSVFEKVSNGEFDKPQAPVVEVDGMTSEDARHTTDMTLQFEMARHAELLPFLAMNPALYDDLYAWLAAQGDRDIDEALAHNAGYQDYREAVGK
ncbi:variant leucine-rich repeat-containing protein [Bifidobacterium platyrrhinorum]|uniref:variant leucine-rich repeat-containing protein n=1 Tax=Bifidobacterium platyrrhinorum TaxID=2661628 RepID=UPI00298BE387|nr:FHA domain-containing protein [Bifidobacterium platyrrhinorum]